MWFDVAGHRLSGGVARTEDPRALVLLCHGIPSGHPDDPTDLGYRGLAEEFALHSYETWWFNFSGARDSEGVFTLNRWMEDLHAVLKEVVREDLSTYVVGSSAGGAVALGVAAENTSIDGVATLAAPAIWDRDPDHHREDMLAHVRRVGLLAPGFPPDEDAWWAEFETNRPEWYAALMGGRPLLIVQGTADTTVRPDNARRLFDAAGEPRSLLMLEGATHQLRRDPRAVAGVIRWLDNLTADVNQPMDGQ